MNNRNIEWRRKKLKQFREEINGGQLNSLREMLPKAVIEEACYQSEYRFRRRLFEPETTVFHMLTAALSPESSFQSAWHLSGQTGCSARLAEARKRLPLEVWQRLQQWTREQHQSCAEASQYWRGHRMIGVDGATVSMSDEPCLSEFFGRQKSRHGLGRFPLARMVLSFDLNHLMPVAHVMGAYKQGENSLFVPLRKHLQKGDVLILDRYYSGANLYQNYQQEGFEFIARVHPRLKMERLKVIHAYGPQDKLVEMRINDQMRKRDPNLPPSIVVRALEISAKVRGKRKSFWIATSLRDAQAYPAQEICQWYKKRWKAETLIREMKTVLGASVLRSKSVIGIYKEVLARFLALQLIHGLILKASKRHGRSPEQISVSATVRLTLAYALKMSSACIYELPKLFDQLLERIAGSTFPSRPDRLEPRLVKREPPFYQKLKIPRKQWHLTMLQNP